MMEDDPVRPSRALMVPAVLDRLGVDELRAYVSQLEAEIARAKVEIGRKQAGLDAAHGLFRTP